MSSVAPGLPYHVGDHQGLIVGLSVIAYQDPRYWPRGDVGLYQAYLGKMASFAHELLVDGHTVHVCSQTSSDDRAANDLVRLLAETIPGASDSSRLPEIKYAIELTDVSEMITACDVAVGARYHFILLCTLLDIPVLALSYHPKTTDLLAQVGRAERALDIAVFSEEQLTAAFEQLRIPDGQREHVALRARVGELRAAVEQQFDLVFSSLAP
jgi:polysaccharide pyruvyl transferase WcaK-like protein